MIVFSLRLPIVSRLRALRPVSHKGGFSLLALLLASLLACPCRALTIEYAINSGGPTVGSFAADTDFSGGDSFSSGASIATGGVTDPAPENVYQTERFGNFSYTFPGLMPGTNYLVRLHFAETYFSHAGQRRFNVLINGTQVLSDFDIVAAAGGNNTAIVKEFTVPADAKGRIIIRFQNGSADNAKCNAIQIINPEGVPDHVRINVDIQTGETYSGTAAAPDTGTVWNGIGSQSTNTVTLRGVLDSKGMPTPYDVTLRSSGGSINTYNNNTLGNPNPASLMGDYAFGNTYTVTITKLPAGEYFLYVYAHGDQPDQCATVAMSTENGGVTATTGSTGSDYRNLAAANAEKYAYLKLQATVGASGTLSFTTNYLNGFQLSEYPLPVIHLQPPVASSAVIGGSFSLGVNATGDGALAYQWRKDGVALKNGISGSGSDYSGATGPVFTINSVHPADTGGYDVVLSNPGGKTTSDIAKLAVTATPLAPVIVNQLAPATVLSTQTARFDASINGTAPLTYVWRKNGVVISNGTTGLGSTISGATTPNLSIAGATLADAGSYSVTATNPLGSITGSAVLSVNQAPAITAQPASLVAKPGSMGSLSATFGPASPTPVYHWEKSVDGLAFAAVPGAASPSLDLPATPANSGFYRVTATNVVGSVISSVIYFGVPTTQSVTLAPANNAANISIDQQLRLVFPAPPKLGLAGALRIHDASNNAVVVTIDRSRFVGYPLFGATIITAAKQKVQGHDTYYLPLAIYGNEVWITLPAAQRLTYGKTYYVTMDAGLLLDSTNAAVPAITSPNAWRFSTKPAGPATPTASSGPTTITVGLDGAGDFATLQGAADWIPQNNTLPRVIRMKPGIYRDSAYFGPGRNFVTVAGDASNRRNVQLVHPYAAEVYGDGARSFGALHIDADDVTVRDLTVDNLVYLPLANTAGAFAPPAPAFAGPINTVATTGRRLVFDNVLIKGGQDTLYTITGIDYFHNCEIWGSVDFIYGDALAVFDRCDIVEISGGPITAPSTPKDQPYGLVFLDSRFPRALVVNGYPYDVADNSTNFMRPWRQDGATAIINCQLGTQITTKAWSEWSGGENTCRAREYGSTRLGGGTVPSPAQRQAAGSYWLDTIDPDYTDAAMSPNDPRLSLGTGSANRVAVPYNPADWTLPAIFGHPYFKLKGWLPPSASRTAR